jgi:AmmeMemoRadiSam system protein A
MPDSEESSERRAMMARRATGLAILLGLIGLGAWLFGRGDRSRIASEPVGTGPAASAGDAYSPDDRRALVKLARSSLESVVREGRVPELPTGLPSNLLVKKGCFVTLTKGGELRGCIGHIFPEEPLARAVIHNARSAALHDTRFSPVTPEELGQIEVEVSVLSVPAPLEFASPADLLNRLRPHQDGVVLTVGGRRATFLPQVWEQLPTPETFLDHLAAKAGLRPGAWREPGTAIMIYHVEAFHESDIGLAPRG